MLLKDTETGWLVEVLDVTALYDPFKAEVLGQHCAGEELQDPALSQEPTLFPIR